VALRVASSLLLVLVALASVALAEGGRVPGAPSCPVTPADSFWHADVSALPVHPQSATWVASIGASAGLKADFGSGTWNGGPIGIPYATVPGTQPRVPVSFTYTNESDPGPYPIQPDAAIEGGASSTGDRHVLVVDRDACRLWELYSAYPQNGGASWTAGSGVTWDLNSNAMRPFGWTSGDAAGLPILPGLVRYDEITSGVVDHVIRFTAPRTANAYVWPAGHKAGTGGASDPPMGAWFRLKPSYDISGFSAQNQVIIRALKKHGMVLGDNGSPFYLSGVPGPGWNNSDLNELRSIPRSAFEAVDVSSLMLSNSSYTVGDAAPPTNLAWPVLSGIARDGQTLTTSNGSWAGTAPISFTYAWRRCDVSGSSCATIAGASGESYVLAAADVGLRVSSLVTATNAAGAASQRSALSAVAVASAPSPSGVPIPLGDLPGWQQIFTDDFATSVPLGGFSNCDAYWHQCFGLPSDVRAKWFAFPDGWKDSYVGTYMPSKVMSIQSGLMNLYLHSENGVRLVSAPQPIIPGGSGSQGGLLYGRYAIRFRADQLAGYKTSWMLWPDSEVWPRDGEIDFPEGDLAGTQWSTMYAFVHHQGATSNSDQDWYGSGVPYGNWHTAIIEWLPSRVTFILDGQTIGTSTSRIPNTPMHWVLQTPTTASFLAALSTAGNVQIDWVAVWKPQ
jgi:hypothetical protein